MKIFYQNREKKPPENPSEILVVDDNEQIRKNFRLFFEKLGYKVREADNGITALKRLTENHPRHYCMIVLDLVMPKMSGMDLLLKMKELYRENEIPPILVCSCHSEVPFVDEIFSLGVHDYITKPVNFIALLQKLKSMLHFKEAV